MLWPKSSSSNCQPTVSYMKISIAIIAVLLSASAEASELDCPARASADYYFLSGTFEPKDDGLREWYSKHLRAMNEPSMRCGVAADTEYRFTWLRNFHHPVAVRVTNKDNIARIDAVELDGAGGYMPGKELRRVSRRLTTAEWVNIHQAMEAWALKAPTEERGLDGSEWIFEQHNAGGYGAVSVWSPTSGPARAMGELFLSKAKITVPAKENY